MSQIETLDIADWVPQPAAAEMQRHAAALEAGKVLFLPRLRFELSPAEKRFLDPRWSDRKSRDIGYDPTAAALQGAQGNASDLEDLRQLLGRFHQRATGLIHHLLPHYSARLRLGPASFLPRPAGRATSRRTDHSRLHIDACAARPNRGERILRVFANVNPRGEPRIWRVGEPFADLARRFLPQIKPPAPGSAALLQLLRITRSRRSEYDHTMLQLHDRMKADPAYQRQAPQETMPFPPGSIWICFSDQTAHAVMGGQHLFEQTLHLPVEGLYDPHSAPLRVLEKLLGRALV